MPKKKKEEVAAKEEIVAKKISLTERLSMIAEAIKRRQEKLTEKRED